MPAFVLFDIRDVTDPDKLAAYKAGVLVTVEAHGGCYRALGGPSEPLERDLPLATPVLIEFPSAEDAKAWHASEAYRPLRHLRQQGTDSAALLIHGCDHPPAGLG
ncbi:MAG: DUF1330 domain-containing protein [Silicimonas sp.]|nr:DUF1330 domain-containing protein [Silicimonas sp.]